MKCLRKNFQRIRYSEIENQPIHKSMVLSILSAYFRPNLFTNINKIIYEKL